MKALANTILLSLLTASCTGGQNDHQEPGAGGSDSTTSSSDTTTADVSAGTGATGGGGAGGAQASPFQVTVLDDAGAVLPNAALIVNDSSGALVTKTQADASGTASLDIPPGGSVSYVGPIERTVMTIVDPPTHNVTIRTQYSDYAATPINLLVAYPSGGIPANAVKIGYFPSCSSPVFVTKASVAVGHFSYYAGCPGSSQFDVAIAAFDAQNKIIALGFKVDIPKDNDLVSGITLTTNVATGSLGINNVPAAATYVSVDVYGMRQGRLNLEQRFDQPNPTGPVTELPVFAPSPNLFDSYFLDDFIQVDEFSVRSRIERITAWPVQETWVPTSPTMPIKPPAPTFAASAAVHFALGSSPPGDVVIVYAYQVDAQNNANNWSVFVAPTTTGTIPILELPSEYAELRFQTLQTTIAVEDVDVDQASGYAQLLEMGFDWRQSASFAGRTDKFDPQ